MVNIASNINKALGTVTLSCSFATIQAFMLQLPVDQRTHIQTTLQVVQFLQTVLSGKNVKLNVNPEYINIRQKTNDSLTRPQLWIETFN